MIIVIYRFQFFLYLSYLNIRRFDRLNKKAENPLRPNQKLETSEDFS